MNSEELREYFDTQIDLIRDRLNMKRSRGWKSELYNLTGLTSQSVTNAITAKDKDKLESYLYRIVIKSFNLSPVELIERINNKKLSIEIEELKVEQTKLFIENNQLKEIMNNIQIELEKRD